MGAKSTFEASPRATLAVSAAVLLVALDLFAGAALPRPGFAIRRVEGGAPEHGRRYDPRYHHGMEPGVRFMEPFGKNEKEYLVVTNSLGFKDSEEREIPADTSKHRVVFLGDSFVEGIGVPYDDTFVGIVDRRLGRERFDVLNAGVTYASPKLYYYRLKHLLEDVGLKVDEVYVFLDISDANNEIELEGWQPGMPPYRLPDSPGPRWEALRRRSYLADLAWEAVLQYREYQRRRATRTVDEEMYDFFKPGVYERWGRTALGHLDDYMRRLAALCRARGIRVTLVTYPHPEQILKEDRAPEWNDFWRRFAARNEVQLLDLFPAFLDQSLIDSPAPPGEPRLLPVCRRFFISGDFHWNAEGHRFVAERLPVPSPP